jgi:hypothetical protein
MKKLLPLLLLGGCASNPHLDLSRGNGYGNEYCPTSGYLLVGSLAGTSAGVISGSFATGGIVALVSGFVMWSNTVPWHEINCEVIEESE